MKQLNSFYLSEIDGKKVAANCLVATKYDHNYNGGDAMTVVRYINNELYDVGKLPPMQVENPALIQIIRDVQRKCIEKQESTTDEKMCES